MKFRICLCTWACVWENEQDAHLLLRRRVAELSKAVQGWERVMTEALATRCSVLPRHCPA